ncbi:MAG: hypothetical protein ACRD3G_29330 [Vicinamibacterales bacterium]
MSLKDIERHVAWFYAAAVRAATDNPDRLSVERDQRLLRRVLRTSEAFTTSVGWLREVKPNPDEILDLAVILTRALDYWNEARARWQTDARRAALSAAAAELAEAADALQDAITGSPWLGTSTLSNAELHGMPRKVQ